MLGVPLAGGGAGTESLLAQAVAAASGRGLVQPGSHVVAAMSYRGDLVLQARPDPCLAHHAVRLKYLGDAG